jgi:2-polyprenyl-3-methyl-5-hydroxy-6-metoxy-1,4-benzoquinol methylase
MPLNKHLFPPFIRLLLKKSFFLAFGQKCFGLIKKVGTLEQMDVLFNSVVCANNPDVRAINTLRTYYLALNMHGIPTDPFSQEYALWQMNLYNTIAKTDYTPANETIPLDTKNTVPYPYSTGSPLLVGEMLSMCGNLIRQASFPAHSSILEIGSGWGNLTLQLAQMGYEVTSLDINSDSLQIIARRLGELKEKVSLVNEDMVTFASNCTSMFDGIIFNASFHHCHNHLEMLRHLRRILNPYGKICLNEEPIRHADHPFLPYPWGLRMDGESVFMTRKRGWLELGFKYGYLKEAFRRNGFVLRNVPSSTCDDLFIATLAT